MEFTSLPDDVLHHIFAFLPLRSVLQMECMCKRLQHSVTAYLSTLKSINLFHHHIKEDIFRHWHTQVRLSPSQLLLCLRRCPRARHIVYLPTLGQDKSLCKTICNIVQQYRNIVTIDLVDSKELLDEVLAQKLDVVLGEVRVVPWTGSASLVARLSPSTFSATSVLHMEDVSLDPQTLKVFSNCYEMSLIRCLFTSDAEECLKAFSFPNIRKFVYVEEPGNSASAQAGSQLVAQMVQSDSLKIFHLGLYRFSVLDRVSSNWLATNLQDLEIASTGSYSAALQQLRYASIVAEICQNCRANLQRVCLPSTILVKQFFYHLISRGQFFPQMKTLEMTGIADTKMFLAPGNMVETLYYQEFLKLCPEMSSLSLHSFSGALNTLVLPMMLGELVLPWDNRINPEKQRNEVIHCISALSHLQSLSIFGVEEVDAMVQGNSAGRVHHRNQTSLVVAVESLRKFRIKNVYVQSLDLTGCTHLSEFSMHCCPSSVSLPMQSLEDVYIYDSDPNNLEKFIVDCLQAKSMVREHDQAACHIHAQLHSILEQESNVTIAHEKKTQKLFSVVDDTLQGLSNCLDFLILKDDALHIFEHNSGEPMYPFTEYGSHSSIASGRSRGDVLSENSRKDRILEGIRRWKKCILDVKLQSSSFKMNELSSVVNLYDTVYCDTPFKCLTNLKFLSTVSVDPSLSQPSGSAAGVTCWSEDCKCEDKVMGGGGSNGGERSGNGGEAGKTHKSSCSSGELGVLNVPHIQLHVKQSLGYEKPCWSQWNITCNPLVIMSIIEYVHCIHTLFYYD